MNQDLYNRAVTDYIYAILWDCTAHEAIHYLGLINGPQDLGHWIPENICIGIWETTKSQIEAGHGNEPVDKLAVNHYLLSAGRLDDSSFRQAWNNIVSPTEVKINQRWRIPSLAAQIVEYTYRSTHHDVYNAETSWTMPLDTLQAMVERDATKLAAIHNRIPGGDQ